LWELLLEAFNDSGGGNPSLQMTDSAIIRAKRLSTGHECRWPAPKVLLAAKSYGADFIREDIVKRGGYAIIPTKRNRLVQLPVDTAIYALRNMVERCFNKLKNARRTGHPTR